METMIHPLAAKNGDGNFFYIKREDLLPFCMGGNKVRIADTLLNDMEKKGCDSMILYGSVHSNLCRVLSDLCCSRNIKCTMICSHEDGKQAEPETTYNEILIRWSGTEIVHCLKSEIAQTVENVMERYRNKGMRPYYIYGSKYGTGNEGVLAGAYAEAYNEITEYEKRTGSEFDYLFCPSGTGATQSGLVCGHLKAGDHKKIIGILISSRETERARHVVAEGIEEYYKLHDLKLPENYKKEIYILDQYRQAGYGEYDDRIISCIRKEYLTDGIPLDPVYTGKAFWGMEEFIREHGIRNSRILFLHTGGTPLFYDFLNPGKERG